MCNVVQKESLRLSFKAGYQGYSIVSDIQAEGIHEGTCKAERRHLGMMGEPLVQSSVLSKPVVPQRQFLQISFEGHIAVEDGPA